MEKEGSLGYKLYKTISFLPFTSFLIQPQFLNFLITTCRTKPNHGIKAKEEGMGKELSISLEDTSLNYALSLGEKMTTKFVKCILFKDHDAIDDKNIKLFTNAMLNQLKALEDNGMNAHIEKALKSKIGEFEGQERASKLFSMSSIRKDQTRKQPGGEIG
ncbi:hypothetical protein M9H77_07205 [Catharanthus roseus]|uniref:Uncharacterized protein n=1 Tax=Catharanthus roseus TaxID=4058 RepID=A0ACC0BUB1_CATRO|nr:hypothetical protein M9H77_07205 [Catharanthus roseus]